MSTYLMSPLAGSVEGANYLATGELVSLSGQEPIQAAWLSHTVIILHSCLKIACQIHHGLFLLPYGMCLLQSSNLWTATPPRTRAAVAA